MRAELANLNHYAVLFLSRAVVMLSWYDSNKICPTVVNDPDIGKKMDFA